MFNNYKELFHAYVEFYRASLFEAPAGRMASGLKQPAEQRLHCLTTASPAGLHDGHNRTLAAARLFQHHDQPLAAGAHNNYSMATERPALGGATTNARQPAHFGEQQQRQPADPRLLLEEGGTKLVRLGSFNGLEAIDLAHIAAVFVLLVLARRLLSVKLAHSTRLDRLGLRAKDRARLDESLWRLLYYSFSSSWLIFSCLRHKSHLLLTVAGATSGGSGGSELMAQAASFELPSAMAPPLYHFHIEWATYAIFMIEAAFYLHATYALLFEDVWRRDSPMMLVHHLAAVFSTLSIYATRTHQIGLASTVLRDTCDVLLEVTKLTKCLHIQHGKRVARLGVAVNCFLSVFALAFAINQLYYFPLFCIFHGLNLARLYDLHTPVMVAILTCGLLFLLLDLLWFGLILRLLYYMALARPLKDLREYDDEDEELTGGDGGRAAPSAQSQDEGASKKHD